MSSPQILYGLKKNYRRTAVSNIAEMRLVSKTCGYPIYMPGFVIMIISVVLIHTNVIALTKPSSHEMNRC